MGSPTVAAAHRSRALAVKPQDLPTFSPTIYRFFVFYLTRYFAKNFNAVRTSRASSALETTGPLVVFANHPSWWDPIHFLLLASFRIPGRQVYGPMDARALEQYSFFKRIGAFGIDPASREGAARFIRTSRALLDRPGTSLWLTAEGQFTDARSRPLCLRSGLAHLTRRMDRGWVVPLAVEYPFWNERHPEALSRFGEPIRIESEPQRSVDEWNELLCRRLEQTMGALAEEAAARDPRSFETLVHGRKGVGGVYDRWRRLKAARRGEKFHAAHGPEE